MMPWFMLNPCLMCLDFSTKEAYHAIRFEKDTRYYSMLLKKDLLDDWVIVITNGRIQSKLGQVRTQAFPDFRTAFDHFCDMVEARLTQHYSLKTYDSDDAMLLQLLPFISITPELHLQKKNHPAPRAKAKQLQSSDKILPPISTLPVYTQIGFMF